MTVVIVLLTIAAYGLAGVLWYRDHAPNYLVALLAGHLGTLPSPLWQRLYQFSYESSMQATVYTLWGHSLPRMVFVAGWLGLLPPLIVLYLHRRHWWFPGYIAGLLTFGLFVLYHMLIEIVGTRNNWWSYTGGVLPLGIQVTFLSALMNGLVSLGMLSLLILTRRYSWTSLLLLLLPGMLLLSLFVHGLLGAPLYTVLLLRTILTTQGWANAIGMLGTLGLLLWGAHVVASSIDGLRTNRHAM